MKKSQDKTLEIIVGLILIVIGLPIILMLLMGLLHLTIGIAFLALPFIGIYLLYSAMKE